ncbi:MAG TPA: ATP-binding protein [Polyangiaceae bacterium]|nr:ATP-binding protein [Polyangiaceae bacterium]
MLGRNLRDIPFSLVYLLDDEGKHFQLAAQAGLERGTPASPITLAMGETDDAGWPLAQMVEHGRADIVKDLPRRFDCLPKEPWDEPAHQAVLLPIARPGSHQPAGVLVLGISPRLAFDEGYRGFFDLVADHVATALSNARAYEEERKRAEKLAELDRVKTAFFSNVSHEFRTPLTLILGPLEDALRGPARSLEGNQLEAVHRSALRLLRLVNSLLDFSRIEADRVRSSFEPTDLPILTAGLAGSFQSLVESVGLKLIVDCPPLNEPVYVDRSQWEKIVLNLVSNAFKFTFEGHIAVQLHTTDQHVELSVSDTGTGIPSEELPKIFDRFHRVEGARGRTFEGTGIGLALVEELVKQHGGSVRVESVIGRGSKFIVTIPRGSHHLPKDRLAPDGRLTTDTSGAAPYLLEVAQWIPRGALPGAVTADVDESNPLLGDVPSTVSGARVLIADDNADMREYLVRLLSPRYAVEAVADGQAALESARERPPDLLLTDVMMPRMNGVELLRALRADTRTSTIKVILLSAQAGEEAVVGGIETGADDYLVKPFSARDLLSRVGTRLELARVHRAVIDAAKELADTRAALLQDVERKNRDLEMAYGELRLTQTQLVQSAKMASLGGLVAGIAHEINNPLAFALGHLDTVRRSLEHIEAKMGARFADDIQPQWGRALDRLRDMHLGLDRIRELVIRLRIFSRLDEGELKRVSIRESIASVITILEHRLKDRISIVTHFGEPDLVECYSSLLNQAVMNLVSNAIDAIKDRGAVTISTGAQGAMYTIVISDTGSGIPENIRDRVLEPFFTTKPVGQGTGLGLPITYSIVKKHGGELELSPAPEGGTVAVVRFPVPGVRAQSG